MKEKTKIAIIGLGGVAQLVHLPILTKLNSVEIPAVAEVNKTRLKTVASKFGITKQYTDYLEMIDNEEIDAVIISTPTNTHKDIAVDCLNNKKHVLIEKPIATNYIEAKEIDDAAKKNKKQAMIGMNFRFRPDTMLLKSLINSGELGDIFYIQCGWTRKQSSEQNWFKKKNLAGGGVLLDLGIVLLDTALWLLDYPNIKNVTAQNFYHSYAGVEDSSVGFVRFNNNSILSYNISWSFHDESDRFKLAAMGTEGTGHLNPLKAYKKVGSSRVDYTTNTSTKGKNLFKKSFENELKHFVGVVNGIGPMISSSNEALLRMRLVEGLYKSAKNNKEEGL